MAILNEKYTRVSNAVAAGTDDTTECTGVDMAGFDEVTFIGSFGTLTANAVTSMHVAGSNDDSTYVDLLGTSVSIDDDEDNQVIAIKIKKPTKYRYYRPEIVRATANAVIDGVVAVQSKAAVAPVTQPATVADSEVHCDPAAGTA
jgi:hypothetical protein